MNADGDSKSGGLLEEGQFLGHQLPVRPDERDWPASERVTQTLREFAPQASADFSCYGLGELHWHRVADLVVLA